MALVPFRYDRNSAPYRRRRAAEGTVVDPNFALDAASQINRTRLPVDPGFTANGVTEEALRQGRADIAAATGQPAPPPDDPVIDPKLLAAVQPPTPSNIAPADTPRVPVDNTAPLPPGRTAISAMPEPPPPMEWDPIVTDKRGRPKVSPTAKEAEPGNILEKQLEAVDAYKPKSMPKWQRFLRIALGAGGLLAGAAAKDPRAVSMAAEGLGRNIGSGKWIDEQWKREQQAEIGKRLDQTTEREKDKATLEHVRAQTKKLKEPTPTQPRAKRIVKDKNGIYRPIDPETGRDENGNLVEGTTAAGAVGGFKGWAHNADGIAIYYEGGKDTGARDPGRNKVKLPDGRLVDPTQSYGAELGAGKEALGQERANEEARIFNTNLKSRIDALKKDEQDVWEWRKGVPMRVTKKRVNPVTGTEESYEEENPEWRELTNRGNKLRDDATALQSQMKPIVPVSRPPRLDTAPPTGGYTEQKVRERWEALPPDKRIHKTADEAVAAARESGLIPK